MQQYISIDIIKADTISLNDIAILKNMVGNNLQDWSLNLTYPLNRLVVVRNNLNQNIISLYELNIYFSLACLSELYTTNETDYEFEINYIVNYFSEDLKSLKIPVFICNNIKFRLYIYIKKNIAENQLRQAVTKLDTKINNLYESYIIFKFSPDYTLISTILPNKMMVIPSVNKFLNDNSVPSTFFNSFSEMRK